MGLQEEQEYQRQYQHYIPQFLLRNFADPDAVVSPVPRKRKDRRYGQRAGDKTINTVILSDGPPKIVALPVKRICGEYDMYRDDSKFTIRDQGRIETKLSQIEQAASVVIRKVAQAHSNGKEDMTLSRHDKDTLRKFLFVMKYRSPIFFRRFNHQRAEDYNADDRDSFLAYMRRRPELKRPLDIWLDNLITIIDTKMDPAGEWVTEIAERIYPGDAKWLYWNIRSMWLSFVTPSDLGEEFILTDNAFSIHEGPVDYTIDRFTGEQIRNAYTEFHVLSVISPRLVMILRHNLLPEPLEDQIPGQHKRRELMLACHVSVHVDPRYAKSMLQDLPIAKARSSYTVVENGQLALAPGADGVPHKRDTFKFPFFRLESRHVQMINLVMLDQAQHSLYIIFRSRAALQKALDFYLDFPTQTYGMYSLKTISGRSDDPALLFLRKLEAIAASLGSNVKARYHVDEDEDLAFDEIVARVLSTIKPASRNTSIGLLATILLQIIHASELTVCAIHTLDLMLEQDSSHVSYPDHVFQAVQKADASVLMEYTKGIKYVSVRDWQMAWSVLARLDSQAPIEDMKSETVAMDKRLRQLNLTPAQRLALAHSAATSRRSSKREAEDGQVDSREETADGDTLQSGESQRCTSRVETTAISRQHQANHSGTLQTQELEALGADGIDHRGDGRSLAGRQTTYTHGSMPSRQDTGQKNTVVRTPVGVEQSYLNTRPDIELWMYVVWISFGFICILALVCWWIVCHLWHWLGYLLHWCFVILVRLLDGAGQQVAGNIL